MLVEILLNFGLTGFTNPIIQATGKIKSYFIASNANSMIVLVFSYLICNMNYAPHYVFIIPILTRLPLIVFSYALLKKLINFPIVFFIKKALLPISIVSVISFLPFYFFDKLFPKSFLNSFIVLVSSLLWTGFIIFEIGLRRNEQIKLLAFIKRKVLLK
jgi:hypothetical protein